MTSPIQRLPAQALDPDALERQFASQLHGSEGAYQLPFLQAAMYDRQRRGQQLQDMNLLANEQAGALAQREMDVTERGQLRTLTGVGYAHGVPADQNLLMIGGMPTPQSTAAVTQAGNRQVQLESDARATQNLGSGAHAAAQGGVDPLAMPGMPQQRIEPLGVTTGRASGAGGVQYQEDINESGQRSSRVRGRDPAAVSAAADQRTQERQTQIGRQQAQQVEQTNPVVRDRIARERAAIQREGGTADVQADANTVTIIGRHPSGRTRTQRIDRTTGRDVP